MQTAHHHMGSTGHMESVLGPGVGWGLRWLWEGPLLLCTLQIPSSAPPFLPALNSWLQDSFWGLWVQGGKELFLLSQMS